MILGHNGGGASVKIEEEASTTDTRPDTTVTTADYVYNLEKLKRSFDAFGRRCKENIPLLAETM